MSIQDALRAEATGKGVHISTAEEALIEKTLNQLFYLPKNIEEEAKFVKQVMTRGADIEDRIGLHASAIIVGEKEFCLRQQVLSLLYQQLQGENINIKLKRIFEEGNAIHEKWQRLFIRGGLATCKDCDFSRFNDYYSLSFTPDIVATINGEKYIVEIKSMNTFLFKQGKEHSSAKHQIQFYMGLTGIHKGVVLMEDKNTQDFRIKLYTYDPASVADYYERLERIKYSKERLLELGKVPPKHKECTSYSSKKCQDCFMRNVCFGKSRVRL